MPFKRLQESKIAFVKKNYCKRLVKIKDTRGTENKKKMTELM